MLGEGLTGRPRAFVLSAIDESAAQARVTVPSGGTVSVLLGQEGNCILALALE